MRFLTPGILLVLLLLMPVMAFSQTSWIGATSTSWSTASNWTNGVPTASTDAIIGDASFTGANQPSISASAVCRSLTVGSGAKASTLTIGASFTVSGSVTIGANGTLIHSTRKAFSLTGNWSNAGIYNATNNNAIVVFSGTAQTLSGATTFRKLGINAGSTTTLGANITVVRGMTVNGTLDPGEPTFTVGVSGSPTLVVGTNAVLRVKASTFAGNYAFNSITLDAASTVDYASTTINQTVSSALTYGTLTISGGTTKTLAGSLTALTATGAGTGNIYVDAGTLDLGSFTANRGTTVVGGTLRVASGATLKIGGTNTLPANYTTVTLGATSTVEYGGANQSVTSATYGQLVLSGSSGAVVKTMPASAMTIMGNLTSSVGTATSVSFTAGAGLTVNGSVTIGSSTTFNGGSFSHTVGGNWTTTGTFTGSTGTVTLSGAGAVLSGSGTATFNNLTVTGLGLTVAAATNVAVAGNLATSATGTLTHVAGGSGTITMSGGSKVISGDGITFNNLTVSGAGSISTSGSFTVAGNLSVSGSLTASAGMITLSGLGKSILGSGTISFAGLSVGGTIATASSFSMIGNLTVSGSLAATAGTTTFNGTSTLSGTASLFNVALNGTRLQLGAGAVLGIAGAFTITAGTFDVTSTVPNLVSYNGSGAQSIISTSYDNLSLAGSGTKSAAGALTINGSLSIGSGTTLGAGAYTHALYGSWSNSGAFTAGAGTVQLLGGSNVTITGATTFNALTVNKSSSSIVTLKNNVSVATLTMSAGTMFTDISTVTITSSRSGSGIILGTITRTHGFANSTAYAFEGPYNTISFASGATNVSSITVRVTSGTVSGFPQGGSVNREYTNSITASGAYSATLRLHYDEAELAGNIESTMQLWRYSTSWTSSGKTANSATDNWVEQSGRTDITGRWTFSNSISIARWTGATSSAWETASNWTIVEGSPNLPPGAGDGVELGTVTFTNQPVITSAVNVKDIVFGSAQATTLTLGTGGSLTTAGNITGSWSANALHTIAIGERSLSVGGNLAIGGGGSNRGINLNLSSGAVDIDGTLVQNGDAGIVFTGAGTLTIGGSFTRTAGTFTPGSSTVTYNGSGTQEVAGGITYNNLSFSKSSGTATLGASATVAGNVDITTGGVVQTSAALTVGGNLTIGSGATLNGDVGTISVAGNWVNGGSFTPGTSTVTFNGAGAQGVGGTTFNHLVIDKAGGTLTPTASLSINGNLSLLSGALDLGSFTANRSAVGGTLTLGSGTTLRVSAGSGFPGNYGTHALAATSTVEYNGSGPQTVASTTYGHLTFSNGGSNAKTFAGPITVAGDLLIGSGATIAAGTYSSTIQGGWTNNGTFTPGSSTITLAGTSKALVGATTFNNLTITGSYVGASDITVNGAASIQGSYAAGTTTATFSGSFVNSGTFTSGGVVTFSGTTAQAIALNSFTSTGTLNYNGTVSPTFAGITSPTLRHVNLNNTGGIAPSSGWTVGGDLTIASGVTFAGSSLNHAFNGSFTNNGSVTGTGTITFNPSGPVTLMLCGGAASFSNTGTVVFGGVGAIAISGSAPTLNNVVISNTASGGVTPASGWSIGSNLTIASGAVFNGGSGLSHTISGNWTNQGTFNPGTSSVTLNNATEAGIAGISTTTFHNLTIAGVINTSMGFNVTGSFTNNGTFDATGSVTFQGSTSGTIGGTTTPTVLDQLVIAKTEGASITLGVNLSDLTSLSVSTGTLDLGTFTVAQDATVEGSLSVAAGGTLKIGGSNTLPVFNSYSFHRMSTVEYNGTGAQTIGAQNYGNLTSSSSGARTLASSGVIGVAGSFTPGTNSYTTTGSTVDFNGTASQTIGRFTFNNLTTSGGGTKTLSGNVGVRGVLTLTLGNIVTGADTLTLGIGTGTLGTLTRTLGTVIGNFRRWFAASTVSNVLFPVGTSSFYRPARLGFTAAPSAGGTLTASFVPGDPGRAGLPLSDAGVNIAYLSIEGCWTLTASTLTGGTYDLELTADGFGKVSDYTTLRMLKRANSGANWAASGAHVAGTGSNATPVVRRSGLSGFSDFGVGGGADNPLPVELASFDAVSRKGEVHLSWSTAAEIDNAGFEVERMSESETSFRVIASYRSDDALRGLGTSPVGREYATVDGRDGALLPGAWYWYRLVDVGLDGTRTSHEPKRVLVEDAGDRFRVESLWPNPALASVRITFTVPEEDRVTVEIFSVDGRRVAMPADDVSFPPGTHVHEVPVAELEPGSYAVRVSTSRAQSVRFIVVGR